MWSLILKDLLLSKRTLPLLLGYGLLMTIVFDSSIGVGSAGLIATTIAITYLLVMRAAAYDEVDKAEVMILSLPVTRKRVVIAKYLSVLVFALVGMLVYGISLLVFILLPIQFETPSIGVESAVGMIFGIILLTSIYLPIYFKLGYMKSRILTIILFLVAFFVPNLILNMAQSGNGEYLAGLGNFLNQQSDAVIIGGILVFCALMLIVSLLLSISFYERREF